MDSVRNETLAITQGRARPVREGPGLRQGPSTLSTLRCPVPQRAPGDAVTPADRSPAIRSSVVSARARSADIPGLGDPKGQLFSNPPALEALESTCRPWLCAVPCASCP